ncbi:MAG: phosphoadenosine phosphosulfate reductase family protein [Blastocatellia bacterium]
MSKLDVTRGTIRKHLAAAKQPAVLCSFGKDSCVLLHFVREQQPEIPVIYFRGFDHPTKHQFADEQIRAQQLNIVEPYPAFRDVIGKGDLVQLVEVYSAGIDLHFPIEAPAGFLPNSQSHCSLQALQRPTDDARWPYDCLFIGHRGDDTDPFWGDIPAAQPSVMRNGCTFAYPLLEWTEADIWEASRKFNIPQNTARYAGDLTANNDYYDLCTNCLKPNGETKSFCPQTGLLINNISEAAGVERQAALWRSRFVNLREDFSNATNRKACESRKLSDDVMVK